MSSEGFFHLVSAIVSQAKADVLLNSPESFVRQDAERFFLSDYFETLTGLDGFEILCKLQDIYEEKQRKKKEKGERRYV